MTQAFRYHDYRIHYDCPLDEAVLLVRTMQRYRGVSKVPLRDGRVKFVSLYGLKPTPFTDAMISHICFSVKKAV